MALNLLLRAAAVRASCPLRAYFQIVLYNRSFSIHAYDHWHFAACSAGLGSEGLKLLPQLWHRRVLAGSRPMAPSVPPEVVVVLLPWRPK